MLECTQRSGSLKIRDLGHIELKLETLNEKLEKLIATCLEVDVGHNRFGLNETRSANDSSQVPLQNTATTENVSAWITMVMRLLRLEASILYMKLVLSGYDPKITDNLPIRDRYVCVILSKSAASPQMFLQ